MRVEEIIRSNPIETVYDQQYGWFNINNLESHNSKCGSNGHEQAREFEMDKRHNSEVAINTKPV